MGLFAGTEFDLPAHCDQCGELETQCKCPAPGIFRLPPEKQTARLSVEKRKKGKIVTVIRGLPAIGNDLPELLTKLKNTCGAGGTIDSQEADNPAIEIQGNHLERIRTSLQGMGFKVKG